MYCIFGYRGQLQKVYETNKKKILKFKVITYEFELYISNNFIGFFSN